MEEMLREIERILEWPRMLKATVISKGFSFDEKYKIELESGASYFIKVCDSSYFERKQEEYEYMQQLDSLHIPMPKLIHFISLTKFNKCVQVFEWIDGLDGEDILRTLSTEEQYRAGKKAGEVLKKIHLVEKEDKSNSWEMSIWSKYERYLEALKEYEVDFFRLNTVIDFVGNHNDLLKNRPIVFLHDDFHPANIMIDQNEFRAVIDFARFDIGDPIHDFYKVALFTTNISKPFAVGQVHGYCGGEPSLHFWKLYTLYAAMTFPADIVWTNRSTPHLVDDMKERLNGILEDHNDFSSYIPKWYQSSEFNK
ncbi:aminoglycoside phosphotransferase family protein [Paenibacillus jamilae]|uniref:Aminoglycoside phosphotransferase n=1 Tax=Bacillus thuringiensis serovar subtoxicus TaxID=475791 RepID=A0A9X6FNL3_BACTU|nr:aminoglycoside phosphotransferase family protein [Bacillus thuringiensis]MEB4841534.1 aminoglycoside phosphotransferase family protein [Paenibacillus jamilae]MEB8581180.1 aminoglycoside phosphotransferase family protein [Bacillus cereus]MCR6852565.1 aminoglycoside phosphotransferase family protein [Bacillus thuringiensis]MDR4283724.1 aminoglycoside phosphotransferase family protein [Bacillus thuringiensis]MEB8596996.1 aminoglycoside phosphotransferase family protein [Bacillus cereus]